MAQTTATVGKSSGDVLDYTPVSNVTAGQVVVIGGIPWMSREAIAANTEGTLHRLGSVTAKLPKDNSVFTQGNPVFWGSALTDVGGTNTGAANNATGVFVGVCAANAAATATVVEVTGEVAPAPAAHAVAAAGGNIATAGLLKPGINIISASDNSKGVILPSILDGICQTVVIVNQVTDKTLKVYPPVGKQVNGAGANNAITAAANVTLVLFSEGANAYYGGSLTGVMS